MACRIIFLVGLVGLLWSCKEDEGVKRLQLTAAYVGSANINLSGSATTGLPTNQPIVLAFSSPVDEASAVASVTLMDRTQSVDVDIDFYDNNKSVSVTPLQPLKNSTLYTVVVSDQLRGAKQEAFLGTEINFMTGSIPLTITSLKIGDQVIVNNDRIVNVPLTLSIEIHFSDAVKTSSFENKLNLAGPDNSALNLSFSNGNKTLVVTRTSLLKDLSPYTFTIPNSVEGENGEVFSGLAKKFYTEVGDAPKFPVVSDEELLTMVQQQTFKYFWDFAHPASGMARERNTSGNTVTSGGSGFGIMSLIVGIERNFITRTQGVERMDKIVSFLETADRFHGAWPHWIDGNNGDVIPFSSKDNGGDLVETSFLVQGLLTFRQYLEPSDTAGNNLINRINTLWKGVEWDWYRKNNENVLYWHWSPNYNWEMNFAMYGYFEEQITYFLAAASPTHSIPKSVYTNGYGKNGAIVKNSTYYTYKLPLESPAPLFWVQYSYLGLDPHFSDDYANYWEQNVNASLINHAYCVANPKQFVGYGDECWGLTSSDNQNGYDAHSPLNDLGVITPTAALSSFPYTPEQSMKALKFFYYKMGDRLWGQYGFYDAFNVTEGWTASTYLAIDQGPIIVMIENYRTGLLWDLFMSAPEVDDAFTKLNFTNE